MTQPDPRTKDYNDEESKKPITLIVDPRLNPNNSIFRTEIKWQAGLTLRQLLVSYNKDSKPMFSLKYYGTSLGYMVESIDSRASDSSHYWKILVNDKRASWGIDSLMTYPGDKIEFIFESSKETMSGP